MPSPRTGFQIQQCTGLERKLLCVGCRPEHDFNKYKGTNSVFSRTQEEPHAMDKTYACIHLGQLYKFHKIQEALRSYHVMAKAEACLHQVHFHKFWNVQDSRRSFYGSSEGSSLFWSGTIPQVLRLIGIDIMLLERATLGHTFTKDKITTNFENNCNDSTPRVSNRWRQFGSVRGAGPSTRLSSMALLENRFLFCP